MALKNQIHHLLNDMNLLCANIEGAQPLRVLLKDMRERLNQPLRLAVVGIMKAGKSTFMNALLGANVVYTGLLETTYTVGWFKYAQTPSLQICFRDGGVLDAPFEDLAKWSIRKYEQENPRINDVKYLIVYYPCEVLKHMEFIDTPGLSSIYEKDAENTESFLGLKSEETRHEASIADAVIYAFSRSMGAADEEVMNAFHGSGSDASPINSIGILTKVDATGIWDIFGTASPVEMGQQVCDTMMQNSKMKRMLFTTFPVCAKPVEGLSLLGDSEWTALEKLAVMTHDDASACLFDANLFATMNGSPFDDIGSADCRKALLLALGQYGALQVSDLLRSGVARGELLARLQEDCGINAVQRMVHSHFGNRTFLIKSRYILTQLLTYAGKTLKTSSDPALRSICAQLKERIDDLISNSQAFSELKALQSYYNGHLQFLDPAELEDFLAVTGEYGRSAEARLGAEGTHTVAELEALAREKIALWQAKANDFMADGAYVDAASIITRSYEYMYYHLNALSEE